MLANTLLEQVRWAGVVGAGGAGFPTHVKLAAKADTVIANGAECEPLLHKDAAILEHQAADVVTGMQLVMEAVGAKDGVIGIKAKNRGALDAVQSSLQGTPIRVQQLGDYYPAGDEYDLVHEVTGRLVPPAGIPLQVGVVVSNVESLANIAAAARGKPVLRKAITIAGAVHTPTSLSVSIGTPWRDCLRLAGGPTTDDVVLCLGGVMMGETTHNLDTPVTKTTTGAVVLPRDHPVVTRKFKPAKAQAFVGKSACDQCRYCTEYCPRYLLGYAVEPHQVMRSLAFTGTGQEFWNQWAALCCSCGLCTWFACPEELFPKEACDAAKTELRHAGMKWNGSWRAQPHPLREGRRVPIKSLMKRLHIESFDVPTPWHPEPFTPAKAVILLKQSAGTACQPRVAVGDDVSVGQVLGAPPPDALGAVLHAPFGGKITSMTPDAITLLRTP
jgi:Na+-translocating ferredoxin:NAD+ oxidoreductase RnfC subunit